MVIFQSFSLYAISIIILYKSQLMNGQSAVLSLQCKICNTNKQLTSLDNRYSVQGNIYTLDCNGSSDSIHLLLINPNYTLTDFHGTVPAHNAHTQRQVRSKTYLVLNSIQCILLSVKVYAIHA